jgi:glucan phosphoethanolaminetransferase (alkaline phosphatase superfamily)
MVGLKNLRSPNMFERILLVIGIFFVMFGYSLLHKLVVVNGVLSWEFLQGLFLWLIIILLLILVAVLENVKEELKVIIREQGEEIRYLAEPLKKRGAKK